MLCKEERGGTADFLLTHPVRRSRVVAEKAAAVFIFVTAFDLFIYLLTTASIAIIGEKVPFAETALLHTAYYLMHLTVACVCFGVSAFLRRGGPGISLGVAALFYVLDILANITDKVKFLKYLTPFGFCDGAKITGELSVDPVKLAICAALSAAAVAAAFIWYRRKDLK